MTTYPEIEMLIDGVWTGSATTDAVINPATGEEIGRVPHASTDDLDRALAATSKGFAEWSAATPWARQQVMEKAARLLEERKESIARYCTMEMGKPIGESRIEMDFAIGQTRWCGEEGRRAYSRVIPGRAPDHRYTAVVEPVGPACAFVAWNFPGTNVIRKVAHALGAGCSLILKPSEETPATGMEIVRAFHDAGVPAGALQLVFGVPDTVSRHLISSPITKKISFTGSVPVGKHLLRLSADTVTRATMELGGHAPVLIFNEADIEASAKVIGGFKYRNAGQVCIAPTRFYVDKPVYEPFVEALTAVAEGQNVGNGLDDGVTMGPLIAERRIEAMERFVADAVDHGARITTGGARKGNQGTFFSPTVLADVPDDAVMMNEEPFGPLAAISPCDGVEEMIERANRLEVGLAGYAFGADPKLADRLSREIQVGMLGINTPMISLPETPFGGIDESGYGHEGGIEGLAAYQRTRLIAQRI